MNSTQLNISWSVSRGQYTNGYNICRLDDVRTGKRYRTCGGNYDMIGTVLGEWIEDRYQDELRALVSTLPLEDCNYATKGYKQTKDLYGLTINPDGRVSLSGSCGVNSMQRIGEALGLKFQWLGNRKGHTTGYFVSKEEAQ